MDGFFVCKIKKLSDKIKGDNESSQVDGEVDNNSGNKTKLDGDLREKPKAKSKQIAEIKKGGKKRPAKTQDLPRKKSKTEKLSVPPPVVKKTIKRTKKVSAKVSQPRRLKPGNMM